MRISLRWLLLRHRSVDPARFARRLTPLARRGYSQNGEDGIIAAIFAAIGTTNRYCVEFGVENGVECNTRRLLEHGWTGLQMDGSEPPPNTAIRQALVTAENVEELFAAHGVPEEFDLLSIDIDGCDYWVWQAITRFRARVVVIEYNGTLSPLPAVVMPYDPGFMWDKTTWSGASLGGLEVLGRRKGYRLIATDPNGVNAFFVDDRLADAFVKRSLEEVYCPLAYTHDPDPLAREYLAVDPLS